MEKRRKGNNSKNSPKGRKPFYYVDNPNFSEIKWLDELNKSKGVAKSTAPEREMKVANNHQTTVKEFELLEHLKSPKEHVSSNESREMVEEKINPALEKKLNPNIFTNDLVDMAVTSDKIAPGAIDSSKLGAKSVQSYAIADGAVNSSKIAEQAIIGDHLKNNSITGGKIADHSIPGNKLQDGSISSEKLADRTISASKIAKGSITSELLAEQSITSEKNKKRSDQPGTFS
jgi:hypothetical protein